MRSTARKAAPHIPDGQLIVDVAKGVEEKTLMTMSEIIEQELAADGKHTHWQCGGAFRPHPCGGSGP